MTSVEAAKHIYYKADVSTRQVDYGALIHHYIHCARVGARLQIPSCEKWKAYIGNFHLKGEIKTKQTNSIDVVGCKSLQISYVVEK